MKKLVTSVVLVLIALLTLSCQGRRTGKQPDATGKATPYRAAKVKLPPKGKDYEVTGQLPGVRKYVVKYDAKLYRGGYPYGQEGFDSLKKLGIRTIVSITPTDEERKLAGANGMKLIELPFTKKTGASRAQRKKFLDAVKTGAPVYVHCHGGTHRASTFCVLYRTEVQGWEWSRAEKEFDVLGGDPAKDKAILDAVRK